MGLVRGRCLAAISALSKANGAGHRRQSAILSVFPVALDKLSTRRRAVGLVLADSDGRFSFSNVLFRATAVFQARIQGLRLLLFGHQAFRSFAVCWQ